VDLDDLSKSLSGRYRVPSGFQEAVLGRASRARRRLMIRWAVAAVLFLAAAVSGVFWTMQGEPPVPPPPATPVSASFPAEGLEFVSDAPYVEVVVESDGKEGMILRLPSVIEIHRNQLQEDFYINNVSH